MGLNRWLLFSQGIGPFSTFNYFYFFLTPAASGVLGGSGGAGLVEEVVLYVALNWGNPWQARADAAKRGRSRRIWPLQLGRGFPATLQHAREGFGSTLRDGCQLALLSSSSSSFVFVVFCFFFFFFFFALSPFSSFILSSFFFLLFFITLLTISIPFPFFF